ncbi:MAG: sortase [bacterium]|nr:sortase [bacterium]
MSKQKKTTAPVNQAELISLYRKALLGGMTLAALESKIERHLERLSAADEIETEVSDQEITTIKKRIPLPVRVGAALVPIVLLFVGLFLVGSAVFPILGSYVNAIPQLQAAELTSPVPQEQVMELTPVVVSEMAEVVPKERGFAFQPEIIDTELDYTNLLNWFSQDTLPQLADTESDSEIVEYTVDIPKIDVQNARVKVGGTNLNEGLIAYPGTALPGEFGSPVIFGHSVLRQFYNPSEKNPRRYNSIFSYIMTLSKGDEIFITTPDGVRYTYIVQEKTEVKPSDVQILTQKYDTKSLKLVTCTPEGTYLRRGVITAQLVSQS